MRKATKRIFKALPVFMFLLFCSGVVNAQTSISGKVTDSKDGSPVPGISVSVKGSKVATATGVDGNFNISVPAGAKILIFSSVGYQRQEVSLGSAKSFDVSMQASSSNLNEVVVIGYGTRLKKDLTSSITTVNAKDFQQGVISTPEQLIAGKVAGVSIISNGGQPGSGSTIRVRGGSSLGDRNGASNDPLFVIDGVALDNSSIAGGNNPLSFINANDIETFTVLRDASATAIYGTRASNGVIIITTKKGKSGKLKLNFSSVNSISAIQNTVSVLTGDQVRSIVNQSGTVGQKAQLGTSNTDWQSLIYQKAFATNNNISFSGGIKGLPYRVSIGYLNQDGILRTDHLEKTSLALVLNPVLFDNHLKVDINLKASQEKYRFANQGAIGAAVYFDPTQSVYSKSKRFGGLFEWIDPSIDAPNKLAGRNPLAVLNDRYDYSNPERSIGNVQFDYKVHFLPDLHVNLNLGYDVSRGSGTIFVSDSSSLEYIVGGGGGESSQYKQTHINTILETYLTYAKEIKSIKTKVDIMAGYSYNDYLTRSYNFQSRTSRGVLVGTAPNNPYSPAEAALLSYFSRANITINDKYLINATIRHDGTSKFGPDNRWSTFPSISLAWKIKEESFLRNNKVISDLKIRGGYGQTGQQEGIGYYDYLERFSLSNRSASYQFDTSFLQGYRPAGYYANLKWETTTSSNIALDYGFLNNRITGSVDFYYREAKELLNNVPQAGSTNFSAFTLANVGSMSNKGVEFTINATAIKSKNFSWDIAFNATYNKNTILNLTVIPKDKNYIGFPTTNINGVQGFAILNAVGGPKNTFYLYHQIYDAAGKPIEGLFEDVNRDGIINENDKYKGHSADPKAFFGFSTNLSYGKWNGGFVMRASSGNYVYNNVYSNNGRLNTILGAQAIGNASTYYLTTLFKGNTDQQLLSDLYVQDASFIKMDNANIGYNFGRIFKNKAAFRANFSVQNVFVITKYKGLDPEISYGVDNNFYPRPRIYALAINLDF